MAKKIQVEFNDGDIVSFNDAHGYLALDNKSDILQIIKDKTNQIVGMFYDWENWRVIEE